MMVRDTRKADKIPVFKGLTELGSGGGETKGKKPNFRRSVKSY